MGQHLATTVGLLNAHRVLNANGEVAEGFHWSDPADRDVHKVLRAEGVRLGPEMRADPDQRLRADELADLIGDVVISVPPEEEREHGWRMRRMLRYLRHFYEAPEGQLHEDQVRALAVQRDTTLSGSPASIREAPPCAGTTRIAFSPRPAASSARRTAAGARLIDCPQRLKACVGRSQNVGVERAGRNQPDEPQLKSRPDSASAAL